VCREVIKNFGLDTDKNGKEESVSLIASATRFRYKSLFLITALCSSSFSSFFWLSETLSLSLVKKNETPHKKKQTKLKKNVDALLLRKVFLCWVHIVVVVVVEEWSEEEVDEIVDIINFFPRRRRTTFDYDDELANGRRRRREQ
jgi:hypothetical protein